MVSLDVDKKQVEKAVEALIKYVQKKENKDIASNFEADNIQMQIGFQKIPRVRNKIITVSLPNNILSETSEVCLFVKDLDKKKRDHEPTVDHFQELLHTKGVKGISQIIPLKQIKLEYKPYEAKRNLSNMYEKFLADERIVRLLPGLLGKSFYGRKRYPIQVNMNAKDLKSEISKALQKTQCIISGRGSTCQVTVAQSSMEREKATENILITIQRICDTIPGGMKNVKTLHLKTEDSPSLPIYVSTESANEVELPPKPPRAPLDEPEEITTVMDAKIRVTPYGGIHIIKDETTQKKVKDNKVEGSDETLPAGDENTPKEAPGKQEAAKKSMKKEAKTKVKKQKLTKQKESVKEAPPSAKKKKLDSEESIESLPPTEHKRKRKSAKSK